MPCDFCGSTLSDEKTKNPINKMNYLDVSSAHITLEDSKNLTEGRKIRGAWILGTYDEGWVLSVGCVEDCEDDEGLCYSEALYKVLEYARECDCTLVRIDADGIDLDERFAAFNW